MTESSNERAPLGHPAEAEVPTHDVEPRGDGASSKDTPVEDSEAYELAVEDGAPLATAPDGSVPGGSVPDGEGTAGAANGAEDETDPSTPVFHEPGEA